ncbi:NirD/YgiW/YdeI family stress tolerance protein [Vibrio vulnificus]|uniref:YgiW/YdeI family stress tolerance OB fold protein n=2 Tax=Vibrio vulnificus TaxID=672 RepID=UPI00102A203C|nr:NirD/YgiW/YdeI family stress tolerance protein [Vibrio vulnificus]RZP74425.1 NirD/YgiW/YdeI family stress tolerance protein [Vibrio vulnificus]
MNKTLIIAIAALTTTPAIALANNSSTAQGISFDGPVNVSVVSELLKDSNMFTEKDVVVEGTLVRQLNLNKDTYIFTDGSAEIQVELDDDIRFTQTINSNTRLRLFGEFEGGNTPEIEVDSLTLL